LLIGHLVNNRIPGVAGVIDDDVYAAKLFDRGVDNHVRKSAIGHIAGDANGLAACRDNGSDSLFCGHRVDIA
jgi:hypothetical protein